MPLANKLPQVKDVPFQGYDVSEFNLNDVGLEAHSGPLFSDCFRLCLSSKRSLSRQEQACLMDCYKKNPARRPLTLLLWPAPLILNFITTSSSPIQLLNRRLKKGLKASSWLDFCLSEEDLLWAEVNPGPSVVSPSWVSARVPVFPLSKI